MPHLIGWVEPFITSPGPRASTETPYSAKAVARWSKAIRGYRLGVLDGKPCFEVPLTDWSHHLQASQPLPIGKWTHIAGTFDGQTMRIYVNGRQQGSMERPGPIHPNTFQLCPGSYEINHVSHFKGLLDEVKLYDRALTAKEIQASYEELSSKSKAGAPGRQ